MLEQITNCSKHEYTVICGSLLPVLNYTEINYNEPHLDCQERSSSVSAKF